MKTSHPFTPSHEEFLRLMVAAEREHNRKLRSIAKFLTFYAATGAIVTIAIAVLSTIF
jgi:hypothetical protein